MLVSLWLRWRLKLTETLLGWWISVDYSSSTIPHPFRGHEIQLLYILCQFTHCLPYGFQRLPLCCSRLPPDHVMSLIQPCGLLLSDGRSRRLFCMTLHHGRDNRCISCCVTSSRVVFAFKSDIRSTFDLNNNPEACRFGEMKAKNAEPHRFHEPYQVNFKWPPSVHGKVARIR